MSTRTAGRFAVTLIAAALAGTALSAGQPQVVGINAAVLNIARIRNAGAPQAHPAIVRERVALADEVQTGVKSQLQILLLDKSTFTVGANARLTIDRFVYDPNRGVRSLSAKAITGAFRFMSGRPDRAGTATINTPVAAIGIRGTIVEGVVGESAVQIARSEPAIGRDVRSDPETASLIILRGPGPRTQGNARVGSISITAGNYPAITLDRPMLAVYVPAPGAAPIGPFTLSPMGLMRVQGLLFPALAERLNLPPPMAGNGPLPRVGALPSETRNLPASALRDADPNFVPTEPQDPGADRRPRRDREWEDPRVIGGKGQSGYGSEPGSRDNYGRPSLPTVPTFGGGSTSDYPRGQGSQSTGGQRTQGQTSSKPGARSAAQAPLAAPASTPSTQGTATVPGAVQLPPPSLKKGPAPTPTPTPTPANPSKP